MPLTTGNGSTSNDMNLSGRDADNAELLAVRVASNMSDRVAGPATALSVEETPSESAQSDLARMLFDHIEGQIKAADSKAWTTITVNGVLAGATTTLVSRLAEFGNDSIVVLGFHISERVIVGVPTFLIFAAIVASLWSAVNALKPALAASDSNNLFFFGNIAQLTESSFVEAFGSQSRGKITHALLGEVHAKSTIAKGKFLLVARSLKRFFFALVFGVVTLLLLLALSSWHVFHN